MTEMDRKRLDYELDQEVDLSTALDMLDMIVGSHDFCDYPHRCKCCGSKNNASCWENPKKPKCDGCKTRDDIISLLEKHDIR